MNIQELSRVWAVAFPLSVTAAGGLVFEAVGIPNGLLIGGLLASLVICRLYRRAEVLAGSLQYVQITIGIELGALFAAGDLAITGKLAAAACLLAMCLMLQIAISFFWLRIVSGWTATDAVLASYPGAMAAVLDLFDRASASPRVIMVHVLRLIVLTVAASAMIHSSSDAGTPGSTGIWNWIAVGAVALASLVVGRTLEMCKVPAPYMLVATFFTAVGLRSGFSASVDLPHWSLVVCEILLALLITIRIKDAGLAEFRSSLMPGTIAIVLMLLTSAGVAWLAKVLLHLDFATMSLSYVPGGVESVAIIAISSGLEASFIMKLHFFRLILVQTAPAVVSLLRLRSSPG
ncbi:hypothetical protein RRU01S_35_00310 [Agrobacterium rubi TR3 = NBRC 13261]|uniref:Ammonia monooxygenase n=1 Tax=Agrobacterium rubi TR3 = NBRC 13261 TaxID=1368415 RepID=A0A081D326_9HYPH|nr:AbrB family transcriptional regulator [Agrobacterium rubi]MBP1881641.1 membrane AbrB-like protein [Agrobacterium rubi]MCL6655467.1 hypothetical protein [Agrobacterium rubi]GAK73322.1 hypothetical protein RRU01S_35_00310 [Agrobacterium rubi TR3 = NBRC 13261]